MPGTFIVQYVTEFLDEVTAHLGSTGESSADLACITSCAQTPSESR